MSAKAKRPKKTDIVKSKSENAKTNIYDVLYHALDVFHSLIKSGHLVGLIVTIVFVCFGISVAKMESQAASGVFLGLTDILTKERFYIIPLIGVIITQSTACYYQKKVYKSEITRLKDMRQLLVHGFENGELSHLKKHNETQFNFEQEG